MKVIGLLGGMSWESTTTYYSLLNRMVSDRLGGLHSAQLMLVSVDFAPLEACLRSGDWEKIATILSMAAARAEAGGADCLLLCTNTMHKVSAQIEAAISIPFFHIVDVLGEALQAEGRQTVGLLGTAFTMQSPEYRDRLKSGFGIDVLVPSDDEQAEVNRIVFAELCLGRVLDSSRQVYLDVMDRLASRGAEAVILGCTEIEMLVKPEHAALPLYDTTALHARYAIDWALADS